MDDGKIIGLLYERNEKGLAEIQSKYGRELSALAERITGSREDAEEIVNDTLTAVWASVPPAYPSPLYAYVLKIARNIACNRVRSRNTQRRRNETVSFDAVTDELSETLVFAGDEDVDEGMITRVINEFLSKQTQTDCLIFVRRYFYADNIGNISKMTGLARGLVSLRLTRMRKKLASLLTEKGVSL